MKNAKPKLLLVPIKPIALDGLLLLIYAILLELSSRTTKE
jgi:hypothetical protein